MNKHEKIPYDKKYPKTCEILTDIAGFILAVLFFFVFFVHAIL
jgi:hypothetical protein